MLVYLDRVTATAPVTITEERGLPVSLENDDVSGNERNVVTASPSNKQVFTGGVAGEQSLTNTSWANVDKRLGLIVATTPHFLYRSAGAPNRSGAREDFLYGAYDRTSRSFQSGDVVAERAAIIVPGASPEETKRIAASLHVSQNNGGMTLQYKGPDGRAHSLALAADGRAIADKVVAAPEK